MENKMPFHFCNDELLAILALLPFIGIYFKRLHAWWHKRSNHKCHKDHCNSTHLEHVEEPTSPIDEWDEVEETVIGERFNMHLVESLQETLKLYGLINFPYVWYLTDNGAVKVKVYGREFIHDDHCDRYGWDELIGGGRFSRASQ